MKLTAIVPLLRWLPIGLGVLSVACAASTPSAPGGAIAVVPIEKMPAGLSEAAPSQEMLDVDAPVATGTKPDRQALPYAETGLLPSPFPVWVGSFGVVNHGHGGGQRGLLPTSNQYTGAPGCYVACYSHSTDGAVYPVGGQIYVKGQLRVPGRHQGRVCHPRGWENEDISAADYFKQLCSEQVPACQGDCWAGGDTGGWFGIARG